MSRTWETRPRGLSDTQNPSRSYLSHEPLRVIQERKRVPETRAFHTSESVRRPHETAMTPSVSVFFNDASARSKDTDQQKAKNNEFGFWFWVHMSFIIPAYLSPLLFNWWIIALGAALLELQRRIIGGCIVTQFEMGSTKKSFTWHYLHKLFPSLTLEKVKFVTRVIVPLTLLGLGLILQIPLQMSPLLRF